MKASNGAVTCCLIAVQEPGKRSQLWRMTGSGMLCHEGSSPPQSKPAQPRPLDSSLVLDIAGLAAVSDNRFVCGGSVLCSHQCSRCSFQQLLKTLRSLNCKVDVCCGRWNKRGVSLFVLPSFEPLMLRRPDSRRSTTQTWYFSSGMLTCGLPRLVVQVGTPSSVDLIFSVFQFEKSCHSAFPQFLLSSQKHCFTWLRASV